MILNIERAGRVCYKSEDRIQPGTAEPFIRAIINSHHLSVIEHSLLTVCFTVNRGVTHELVRHRIASFSQESTRYVNYGKKGHCTFVIPPWITDIEPGEYNHNENWADKSIWWRHMMQCEIDYNDLLQSGWNAQKARDILPVATKADIVVSTNFREWRHIRNERKVSPPAHPAMAEVIGPLIEDLAVQLPVIFGE